MASLSSSNTRQSQTLNARSEPTSMATWFGSWMECAANTIGPASQNQPSIGESCVLICGNLSIPNGRFRRNGWTVASRCFSTLDRRIFERPATPRPVLQSSGAFCRSSPAAARKVAVAWWRFTSQTSSLTPTPAIRCLNGLRYFANWKMSKGKPNSPGLRKKPSTGSVNGNIDGRGETG